MKNEGQYIYSFVQKLTAHSAGASTLGAKHVLGVRVQQSLAAHFRLLDLHRND